MTSTAERGSTTPTIGWQGRYFEDFAVGDRYQHPLGRTVIQTDNSWFTLLIVAAGADSALTRLDAHAEGAGRRLNVAAPSHCPLMAPVTDMLVTRLKPIPTRIDRHLHH